MQTLREIRGLLQTHGLRPQKRFGQNFLIDHNLIRRLVDASGVGTGDLVLEVGPGTGTMSEELLERGCEVVACELDRGLCALLRERLGDIARFTLIEGDCLARDRTLSVPLREVLADRPFRVVANLPYGAASPLISTILVGHPRCAGLWVTIQKEVCERLTARPGTRAYGALSVVAQVACELERIATLPPGCFWPRPEVTSAMVAMRRHRRPIVTHEEMAGFSMFLQRVFTHRRKQLRAVLGVTHLPPGFAPTVRAEALAPGQLVELWRLSEQDRGRADMSPPGAG